MVFSPRQAMELALQEAQKGIGWVEPNPPVGCVILDSDYRFLSSGYHEKYGMAHAEVNALKKIRDKKKLKGAHVFVTLEPCHHTGKTPPCSLELVKYPIQSLTYGVEEPFTRKKGLSFLKEKKIKIIHNTDFKKENENLKAPFKF
ncbi:MAG: riboflavin biosynthesis protein RibD, partial [Oligoflexia bacterium]|nr:riboflavin biosynthesis protein RibD [Oligoflexia bacterium]